jgi:hypothetical protein
MKSFEGGNCELGVFEKVVKGSKKDRHLKRFLRENFKNVEMEEGKPASRSNSRIGERVFPWTE